MSDGEQPRPDPGAGQARDERGDEPGGEQERLRNPFRSESDAFRLLVIIGGAIAVMIAAAKLGGPWVGIPVAVVVFGVGIRATWRWLRLALADREAEGPQPL